MSLVQPLALLAVGDPASAAAYQAVLEIHGFDAVAVLDGFDAADFALARRPSLIVVDRRVPGLDALALCRLLKARRATDAIPLIVLTASTLDEERATIAASGADQVLVEPCAPELLGIVATLLVGSQAVERDDRPRLARRTTDLRSIAGGA